MDKDTKPLTPFSMTDAHEGDTITTDITEWRLFVGREMDSHLCAATAEELAQMRQDMPRGFVKWKRGPRQN